MDIIDLVIWDSVFSRQERWLPVVGYECNYEVSNYGRVRSVARVTREAGRFGPRIVRHKSRYLQPYDTGGGYPTVTLGFRDKQKVHHLVLEAFVGPRPTGLLGLHMDDVKTNNNLSNLYWGTYEINWLDAIRNGGHSYARLSRHIRHVNRSKRKLSNEQVLNIKQLLAEGKTTYRVEQITGVTRATISDINRGRIYVDV